MTRVFGGRFGSVVRVLEMMSPAEAEAAAIDLMTTMSMMLVM